MRIITAALLTILAFQFCLPQNESKNEFIKIVDGLHFPEGPAWDGKGLRRDRGSSEEDPAAGEGTGEMTGCSLEAREAEELVHPCSHLPESSRRQVVP